MISAFLVSISAAVLCSPLTIVLLSVDTLRPDYLGCYGCVNNISPNLDGLAKESLVFEDCVCEVPLTGPACGSMLTSLYPRLTGTVRNGLRMPASVPLIAESFHAADYQTFCVQSNWTLKAELSGLDRGFDVYEDNFHTKRWGVIKPERYANEVTDLCLRLLNNRDQNRPFFLWVHYSDPHAPYRFHKAYNPFKKKAGFSNRSERTRARYASEVAFTDYHIGRLFRALPKINTAVVFVADHGESLYEHGYLGHGRRIYQSCIQIPLMIMAPKLQAGRTTVCASGIDIAPTLLSLARLHSVPGMLGRNLLEVKGEVEPRVFETYGCAVPNGLGVENFLRRIAPQQQGVIRDGWRLIAAGQRFELYNISQDAAEARNLAKDMPPRVNELKAIVEEWNRQHPRGESVQTHLSPDDKSALESLGYLK